MKQQSSQTLLVAVGLFVILMLGVFVLIEWSRGRVGTIVLPAGGTYLGPTQ